MQRLVGRAIGHHHAVAEGLEIALEIRERRTKLVRGIRDELAPHPLLLLNLVGHAIERVRERSDLLGAARLHAHSMIAPRDKPRRGAHLSQRRGDTPSDKQREADAG